MTQVARRDTEHRGFLTIAEVADYIRIPRQTLYKHLRAGKFPGVKVGKHWRFTRLEVEEWLHHGGAKSVAVRHALVVEDQSAIRELMRIWLTEAGFHVVQAENGEEAVRLVLQQTFQIVFLDLHMPRMSGVEALRALRKISPDCLVVVVSGYIDNLFVDEALDLGPISLIRKPVSRDTILSFLRSVSFCAGPVPVALPDTAASRV